MTPETMQGFIAELREAHPTATAAQLHELALAELKTHVIVDDEWEGFFSEAIMYGPRKNMR